MATHLRENPIKSCSRYDFNPYDSSNSDYIYGSSNYMIIFPNDGIRINATKSFINSVPALREVFSTKWSDKALTLDYYSYSSQQKMIGPTIYVSYSPLEMFIYDELSDEMKNCVKDKRDNLMNSLYLEQNLYESVRYSLRYL